MTNIAFVIWKEYSTINIFQNQQDPANELYLCILLVLCIFFNCMLVLFSRFGYNEINIHTHAIYKLY